MAKRAKNRERRLRVGDKVEVLANRKLIISKKRRHRGKSG